MVEGAKRTVSLLDDDAAYVDELVASGAYGSATDVISAGLSALRDHGSDVERWLQEEVIPAYDEVKADPSSVIPIEKVFADLHARHKARFKSDG